MPVINIAFSYQVLLAVLLGIASGLFFGPFCNVLQPISDIYVMFLKMVAIPYLCVSLLHGLGSMTPSVGKKLFKQGLLFWIIIWGIAFAVFYSLTLLIPHIPTTIVEVSSPSGEIVGKNFIEYLIPVNPFYDLVHAIIPALALSSVIFGIALMHLERKEPLLSFLEATTQLNEKILHWLAIFAPIGIFCRIAVAFGTVDAKDLYTLQFYVITVILMTICVTFWIFPALLSIFTSLTFRQACKTVWSVSFLPFATGIPTIALPCIIRYIKKLGAHHALGPERFQATSQTVFPLCYSFGQIGNVMIFFFVAFISFFYRHPFSHAEKSLLFLLMFPLSIGSMTTSLNALSFLIEQFKLPSESFAMFTHQLAITTNFQALMSAASILSLVILILHAYYGMCKFKWRPLLSHFALFVCVFSGIFLWTKKTIHLNDHFQNRYANLKIADVILNPVHAKIRDQHTTVTSAAFDSSKPSTRVSSEVLSDILTRGVLNSTLYIFRTA